MSVMHLIWPAASHVFKKSQQVARERQVSSPLQAFSHPSLQALTCFRHVFLASFLAFLLDFPALAVCGAANAATMAAAPRALSEARRSVAALACRARVSNAVSCMALPAFRCPERALDRLSPARDCSGRGGRH